ncbi:M48 family metallopeptidase [Anaerovorax sp. IOR16]|uniref:M48 family metallopeptidase n=1 Tax=Anaerovorax sp. IOR16 TaxID=2773458 RepID=UPI0019D2B36A|nr:SprT family zinc-dependent metalloprotease [Anaerovorax sp. IOR16]
MKKIILDKIEINIEKKTIKHLHLYVKPPLGEVFVSAPKRLSDEQIRAFLQLKLSWIKKHQQKFLNKPMPKKREFVSGETVCVWGQSYQLEVISSNACRSISLEDNKMILRIHEGSTFEQRERLIKEWYRKQLQDALPAIIEKYENRMGVHAEEWKTKSMKTRWGTCNITVKRIWLNLKLAKKHPICLEYVVVHELCHLLERNHNAKFKGYMDLYFPDWKEVKKELNNINN